MKNLPLLTLIKRMNADFYSVAEPQPKPNTYHGAAEKIGEAKIKVKTRERPRSRKNNNAEGILSRMSFNSSITELLN